MHVVPVLLWGGGGGGSGNLSIKSVDITSNVMIGVLGSDEILNGFCMTLPKSLEQVGLVFSKGAQGDSENCIFSAKEQKALHTTLKCIKQIGYQKKKKKQIVE